MLATPWLRAISVVVATAVCLLLTGCGSSSSNTPPPPPAPLGHAYITTASNLYGFSISASNGSLSSIATPSGAPGGTAIASNTQKDLLYTLTSSGQIFGYSVNTSNGSLTGIAGSPWGGAGVGVAFLTVDVAGQYLFVPATQDFNVVPFTIGSGGALTIGLQVATPAAPLTATVDPQAHFLYVPMGSTGTELFKINGGALSDLGTIPPLGATKPQFVAITPSDTFAYISDGVTGVAGYSVNATTGALTALPGAPFTAGPGPSAMAMTPNGKYLYVATSVALVQFAINSDGSLTSIGSPVTFNTPPVVLNIDTTGTYVYVVNVNSSNVSVYQINAASGVLAIGPVVGLPAAATGIALTP
ncbi:MAG: lactonase family protein [Candidatus Korobacteraceae bacterium]